jgi:hypothetical protein
VRILGWLAVPETVSAVCFSTTRLARIVLEYRLRCKEIDLLREQRDLVSGSQLSRKARARHAGRDTSC